jgi:hypothetical protein
MTLAPLDEGYKKKNPAEALAGFEDQGVLAPVR